MIIDCVSDLHGFIPELKGGDLLIIAGDITATVSEMEWVEFANWISSQNYKKIILIGGNHDNFLGSKRLQNLCTHWDNLNVTYLCDSGTEFKGLKIWGSPWTQTFQGMNPHCMAFTCESDKELSKKWNLIPDDIDILITHSPPYGILDRNYFQQPCGSVSLRNCVLSLDRRNKLKLHVFGHIHECGGKEQDIALTKFVNASFVDEMYEPKDRTVRIIL